jgi:hypothetical protein
MRTRCPEKLQLLLLLSSLAFAGRTGGQTPLRATPDLAPRQTHATRSDPGKGHINSPQSALDAVSVFYTYITRYQPVGIPQGRAKKALWPLLSKRLVHELDSLQACEDDYYGRYGDIFSANHLKPEAPYFVCRMDTGSAKVVSGWDSWDIKALLI